MSIDLKMISNKLNQAIARGAFAEALDHGVTLLRQNPTNRLALNLCAEMAVKAGQPVKALSFLRQAEEMNLCTPMHDVLTAEAMLAQGDRKQAQKLAAHAVSNVAKAQDVLERLGYFLSVKCENHEAALKAYEKSVALQPANARSWYNLGAEQRFLGQLDDAEISWNKAIDLGFEDSEILLLRAQLRRKDEENNDIADLTQRLAKAPETTTMWMHLHYALAKEYEDIGDYPRSFSHLQQGSDARRKRIKYDVQDDLSVMQQISDSFDADIANLRDTSLGDACQREGAIFIVGLPRTGTTLVERILSSHAKVESLGELNDFAVHLTRIIAAGGASPQSRSELVKASLEIDFNSLGDAYMQSIQSRRSGTHPSGTDMLIDKLPLNFLYCGLIKRALPQAKIIHLTRHPMDTIYAIYKQLFKSAYPMSYHLEELTRYYIGYRQLMAHWEKLLPGEIFHLGYEQLVTHQEDKTRALLDYLGLPWDPACLQFHKNADASTTASATQIRQPVYASSMGKWENYSQQLAPVADMLKQAGIDQETWEI